MAEVLIKVEHLHKQFKNQEVLHDISVEIHKGDVISIIGPSGSGKSTFLRCLNALESPTKGDIFFEGQSVLHSKNVDALRQKMGMVFQQGINHHRKCFYGPNHSHFHCVGLHVIDDCFYLSFHNVSRKVMESLNT